MEEIQLIEKKLKIFRGKKFFLLNLFVEIFLLELLKMF